MAKIAVARRWGKMGRNPLHPNIAPLSSPVNSSPPGGPGPEARPMPPTREPRASSRPPRPDPERPAATQRGARARRRAGGQDVVDEQHRASGDRAGGAAPGNARRGPARRAATGLLGRQSSAARGARGQGRPSSRASGRRRTVWLNPRARRRGQGRGNGTTRSAVASGSARRRSARPGRARPGEMRRPGSPGART